MKKLFKLTCLIFLALAISCKKDDPGIKTFQFYVTALAYNSQSGKVDITESHINVAASKTLFDGDEAAGVNKVTVDDGNSSYTVTITKSNHITYTKTFTADELKAFTETSPLTVTLVGVNEFQFYMNTLVYSSQLGKPDVTTSHVTVATTGKTLFDGDGVAGANKITIDDSSPTFTVTVTKANYITSTKTYSVGQLKAFTQTSPLSVTLLDQSLTNGLVASYSFNGDTKDGSGNHNDATLFGSQLTAGHSGVSNSAYQLNGTSDYIGLPTQVLKNNNYSFSIWMKVEALPTFGNAVCVFSIGDVNDTKHQTLALANNYSSANTTGMSVGGYNNGSPSVSSTLTNLPSVGQWYHIVGVRSNASLSIYVNGSLAGTADAGGTTPYYGTTVAAYIGARCNLTQYFKGSVDDVAIYNRAITDQEVKILYLEGIPGQ